MFNRFFFFFQKILEKYGKARLATDDIIMPRRKYTLCTPDNEGRNTRTHTLIIFSTYHFSMVALITRTRINVTLYVHCLSCFYIELALFRL